MRGFICLVEISKWEKKRKVLSPKLWGDFSHKYANHAKPRISNVMKKMWPDYIETLRSTIYYTTTVDGFEQLMTYFMIPHTWEQIIASS